MAYQNFTCWDTWFPARDSLSQSGVSSMSSSSSSSSSFRPVRLHNSSLSYLDEELSLDLDLRSIPSVPRDKLSSRLEKLEAAVDQLQKGRASDKLEIQNLKDEIESLREEKSRNGNGGQVEGAGLDKQLEKFKDSFQGVFDQVAQNPQMDIIKSRMAKLFNDLGAEIRAHEFRCEQSMKTMQSQLLQMDASMRGMVDNVKRCILENNQRDQFNTTQLSKHRGMLNQHDAQLQDAAVRQSAADESLTSLSRDLEQTRVDLTERVDQTEQVVNRLADDVSTDRSTSCHNFRELRENGYLIDYAAGHPEDAGG